MSTPISASSDAIPARPKLFEKQVTYAFLRLLGATQRDAGRAVGRKVRSVQDWEYNQALWEKACTQAEKRFLADLTAAARKAVLESIQAGDGALGLKVLERLLPALAPPTYKVNLHHEAGEGLSGLLRARRGGDHADTD